MASIRRTQSPAYHDHHHRPPYHNGAAPPPSSAKLTKPSKKATTYQWRRSLYRCLTFFALGILIGMTPFSFTNHIVQNDAVKQLGTNAENSLNHGVLQFSKNVKKPKNDSLEQVEGFDGFSVNAVRFAEERVEEGKGKLLIVVTPTYNRAMQGYFLTRLGQVLRLVPPPVLWVVVEESAASFETADILRKTRVMYRHLVCKLKNGSAEAVKDRGVHQRNTALEHIELHRLDGVVYFADDDNVYSLELFERLRDIRRFGTWPVAMLAQSKNKAILEGPVCNGSQVIGWHTNEKSKRLRRFHVDMSGFAFNSTILWDPKRWKRPTRKLIRQLDTVKEGFQETTFIEQVVEDESQMEGIQPGCSKIMNWHLHLGAGNLVYPKGWLLQKNLDVVVPVR